MDSTGPGLMVPNLGRCMPRHRSAGQPRSINQPLRRSGAWHGSNILIRHRSHSQRAHTSPNPCQHLTKTVPGRCSLPLPRLSSPVGGQTIPPGGRSTSTMQTTIRKRTRAHLRRWPHPPPRTCVPGRDIRSVGVRHTPEHPPYLHQGKEGALRQDQSVGIRCLSDRSVRANVDQRQRVHLECRPVHRIFDERDHDVPSGLHRELCQRVGPRIEPMRQRRPGYECANDCRRTSSCAVDHYGGWPAHLDRTPRDLVEPIRPCDGDFLFSPFLRCSLREL